MEELESKEKRILVIIDTNQLGSYSGKKLSCNNYSFLETNKYLYQNIVNNFNYEKITKIHIALPEIVLGEILNQQVSCFNEDFSKLKNMFAKFSKLEGFELNCAQLEYRQYLEEKMNNYLGAYSIIKIKNPPIEILPKLIKKVLLREKPFYKKENGVDSGFKDAIIWESINEFVKENSYDKYFFLTNDLDFNDKILQEEFFKNSSGKKLEIFSSVSDLKGKLEKEIKGTEEINNFLKIVRNKLKDNLLCFFENNFIEVKIGESVFEVTQLLDYKILDIEFKEDLYELNISLIIEHETPYMGYGFVDESFMQYEKDIRQIECLITFDKNYEFKKISSGNLFFNGT